LPARLATATPVFQIGNNEQWVRVYFDDDVSAIHEQALAP
jgi:hypothetical protein